jgi:hypothetical protein
MIGRSAQPIKGGPAMLPPAQRSAYGRFYKSARQNEILDPKTTLLLHFGAAMAFACYP